MSLSYGFDRLAYDFYKIRLDAGTSYEGTINIRVSHKFADIVRGDAATVEYTYGGGGLTSVHITVQLTNQRNYLACSLTRGGFAGADGPDRLVGNNNIGCLVFRKVGQTVLCLRAYDLLGLACFVLFQALADNDNGTKAVSECSL